MKIVLSTRSMHPELTKKAQSLFDSVKIIDEYRQLKLKSDWEYLDDCIYNTDADVTISIDEDFFLIRPNIIPKIVDYIVEKDIGIIGPKSTTTNAPIIDSWFHISYNKLLKQQWRPTAGTKILLRVFETQEYFKKWKFNSGFYPFDKHEFFFLLMLERGCKFHILSKNDAGIEVIKARNIEFGFHTRNGRDYEQKEQKQRIDEIYNFVRSKYHEKYFDNS